MNAVLTIKALPGVDYEYKRRDKCLIRFENDANY